MSLSYTYMNKKTKEIWEEKRNHEEKDKGCDKNIVRLTKYWYKNNKTGEEIYEFREEKDKDKDCDGDFERFFPSPRIGDQVVFSSFHKKRQARLETEVFNKAKK